MESDPPEIIIERTYEPDDERLRKLLRLLLAERPDPAS